MLDVEAKVARISVAESTVNVYEAIKLRLEHLPLERLQARPPPPPPTS